MSPGPFSIADCLIPSHCGDGPSLHSVFICLAHSTIYNIRNILYIFTAASLLTKFKWSGRINSVLKRHFSLMENSPGLDALRLILAMVSTVCRVLTNWLLCH